MYVQLYIFMPTYTESFSFILVPIQYMHVGVAIKSIFPIISSLHLRWPFVVCSDHFFPLCSLSIYKQQSILLSTPAYFRLYWYIPLIQFVYFSSSMFREKKIFFFLLINSYLSVKKEEQEQQKAFLRACVNIKVACTFEHYFVKILP